MIFAPFLVSASSRLVLDLVIMETQSLAFDQTLLAAESLDQVSSKDAARRLQTPAKEGRETRPVVAVPASVNEPRSSDDAGQRWRPAVGCTGSDEPVALSGAMSDSRGAAVNSSAAELDATFVAETGSFDIEAEPGAPLAEIVDLSGAAETAEPLVEMTDSSGTVAGKAASLAGMIG